MKQHIGVFRRIPEATLALEWIEECLGKTKWWIHILDCAFPIVEEHILDCALQYRKDDAGQLVLLSDDINLKIKSMAKVFFITMPNLGFWINLAAKINPPDRLNNPAKAVF